LQTKSQTVLRFHADGRLDTITDPSRNAATRTYINNSSDPADSKLDYATDPAGRVLNIENNQYGYLAEVRAMLGVTNNPNLGDNYERVWQLLREDSVDPDPITEGDGYFVALRNPLGHDITWEYDANLDIAVIRDEEDRPYSLDYTDGWLTEASNPLDHRTNFGYTVTSTELEVEVEDLRANIWTYCFNKTGGNLKRTLNPYNEQTTLTYVSSPTALTREVATVTNPLNKTWTMTYDSKGNVLTSTDPLGNKTTYEYDTTGGLNNLVKVTPPGATPGT